MWCGPYTQQLGGALCKPKNSKGDPQNGCGTGGCEKVSLGLHFPKCGSRYFVYTYIFRMVGIPSVYIYIYTRERTKTFNGSHREGC